MRAGQEGLLKNNDIESRWKKQTSQQEEKGKKVTLIHPSSTMSKEKENNCAECSCLK